MKKYQKLRYQKPTIKSSKIKTVFLYGRDTLRSAADSEYLSFIPPS